MQRSNTINIIASPVAEQLPLHPDSSPVPGRFSVVVPVFNCKETLRECFDSLTVATKNYGNAEVIAVDNGSTDGCYEILKNEYRNVTLLRYPDLSIAALRNRGVQVASGEYLSFIDADCIIPPEYFDEARATFRDSDVAATGSMCGIPESSSWVERTWYALNSHSGNGFVKYMNSGNFVVQRQVFVALGGFNEKLTTGEDTEIGQRLRNSGFRIYENHRVRAIHLRNSKTLGQFFLRHAWHGQGLLIPSSASWLNRPLLMTFGHLALIILGVGQLLNTHVSLAMRIVCLGLAISLVPAVTFLFRSATNRRLPSPLAGIVLYQFYYLAKLYALGRFATRRRSRTYHQ